MVGRDNHSRKIRYISLMGAALASITYGQTPYGLDSRAPIGPYLNNTMPSYDGAFPFPTVLSATGAFSDVPNVVPTEGLIPFAPNSPLWSDGALKSRWIALRSEEHTSELQSPYVISYAVFCLKK